MPAPITRHQRELCNLAIVIAQQQETIDRLSSHLKYNDAQIRVRGESLSELRNERETLLAENTSLRADIDRVSKHEADTITAMSAAWQRVEGELKGELDEHVSLIHRLCDDRVMARLDYGTLDKMTKLYQAQSLEFCRNYEREEARANKATAENKRLHAATEDDLRTITKLRRAIRLMLAGASTRDMRRKLKAIVEGVMGE